MARCSLAVTIAVGTLVTLDHIPSRKAAPMSRTAAAFALTLTLLTGIVLGQLHSASSTRSFTTEVPNPRASQTAASFYQAINSLLETGNPADLRSILHSDFIDHSPIRQEPG